MNIDKQQMDKAIKAYMSKSDEGGNWTERVRAGLLAAAPFLQQRTPAPQETVTSVNYPAKACNHRWIERDCGFVCDWCGETNPLRVRGGTLEDFKNACLKAAQQRTPAAQPEERLLRAFTYSEGEKVFGIPKCGSDLGKLEAALDAANKLIASRRTEQQRTPAAQLQSFTEFCTCVTSPNLSCLAHPKQPAQPQPLTDEQITAMKEFDKQQMDMAFQVFSDEFNNRDGRDWDSRTKAGLRAAAPFLQHKPSPQDWQPCSHLPGYEQRINATGGLETRPLAQERTPAACSVRISGDNTPVCAVHNEQIPLNTGRCPVSGIGLLADVPAQPQAGDVVERMLDAWNEAIVENAYTPTASMTAALAVAREGYVRLEEVEKAIREDDELSQWHSSHLEPLVKRVRFRLTPKPPERVTIRPVHGSGIGVFQDGLLACPQFFSLQQDAERYAAGLRKELEGKNG